MEDWWRTLDEDMIRCVARDGVATPTDIALELGMSEAAACSLLAMLVREGRLRIALVAVPAAPSRAKTPAIVRGVGASTRS
jgi:hypothetical protein